MSAWYRAMVESGCWMHYISNSPLELWDVIEGFLTEDEFPRGRSFLLVLSPPSLLLFHLYISFFEAQPEHRELIC